MSTWRRVRRLRRWVEKASQGLCASGLLGCRGEEVPFPTVALAHPFEYSNGALVRKVPDQCLSDWAEVVK